MTGFVHVEHGELVDGRRQPLVLRGVGLGNWLLPEGYMWKFESPGPQSPREIEAMIEDLVGPVRATEFWRRFWDGFITEDDIARIRAEGMNHVRLPINSRLVLAEGFELVDRLIDWCRRQGLWVVLDLHGAPGGQTGTNIDDSPHGAPELFMDERYWAATIELWIAIAKRYRDETAVAVYDLLNEPLPNEYQLSYSARLRDLYLELTRAIREIDPNHAITYEGSHWASNWSIFDRVWDGNSILQFHKYWSPPDRPSIQKYIDVGRDLGLPIYMGEGGENNLDWIHTAFQLYDDWGISWNFWTWKKVETRTSPYSVDAPAGWGDIIDYAARRGPKPSAEAAWQTLEGLIEGLPPARCTYRSEVISALLRRPPMNVPAWGFGFRGPGVSYQTSGATPLSSFRSDDQVTIQGSEPVNWHHSGGAPRTAAEELLVSLGPGDWVAYDFTPLANGNPSIEVDVQSGAVKTSVEGRTVRVTGLAPQTLVRRIEVTPGGRQPVAERKERSSSVA